MAWNLFFLPFYPTIYPYNQPSIYLQSILQESYLNLKLYYMVWNLYFYLSLPLSMYLSIHLPIHLSTIHIVGKLLKSKVGLYGLEYLDKDQQNFEILPQNETYIGCACIKRKGKSFNSRRKYYCYHQNAKKNVSL